MTTFADRFKTVFGRDMSDKERQSFDRFIATMGIREQDALLTFFLFQEQNLGRFEAIPASIGKTADDAERLFAAKLNLTKAALLNDLGPELAKTVVTQSNAIAGKKAWTDFIRVTLCAVMSTSVILLAVGYIAHDAGLKTGNAEGYAQARDEKAAAAWATTPEGRVAYSLALAGSLRHLADCDGPGWKIENHICRPYATAKGGTGGWHLPQ